jgi:hypothetical protein
MTERTSSPWAARTAAALRAKGWPNARVEGASVRVDCAPSADENPPRKTPYHVVMTSRGRAAVDIVAVCAGDGAPHRWRELTAFAALLAPRLRVDVEADDSRCELRITAEKRWPTAPNVDALESAMCEVMTRMGRVADLATAVLRRTSAARAMLAFETEEAGRL